MSKTTGIRRHNASDPLVSGSMETDSNARVEVRADGSIAAGPGGTAPDSVIRRADVGSWAVPLPVTAGVPTDGDFYTAPPNGTMAINGASDQVYYRKGGVWTQLGVDPTAPGAPGSLTAQGGDTQVTLDWTAAAPHGSAVTGYIWTIYKVSDDSMVSTGSVGVVLTKLVTGLTNGTAVYGKVAAVNAIGTGPQSAASNSVTPGVTVLFADSFNRADATSVGSPWVESSVAGNSGRFGISANRCVETVSAGGVHICTQDATQADHAIQLDIINFQGEVDLILRASDKDNCLLASFDNDTGGIVRLYERRAGVQTNVGNVDAINPGDSVTVKASVAGDVFKLFVSGSEVLSVTLSGPVMAALGANTRAGIGAAMAVAYWDPACFLDNLTCTSS